MQRLCPILGLLLAMALVGYGLGRQLNALTQTLDRIHRRQGQGLQEQQRVLDAHTRRMERY